MDTLTVAFLLVFLLFSEVASDKSNFTKPEERSKSPPGDELLREMSPLKGNLSDETEVAEELYEDVIHSGSRMKIGRWHPARRKSPNERKFAIEDHKTRMGVRYRLKKKRTKSSLEYTTITSRDRYDNLIKESRNETSNYIRKSRGISSPHTSQSENSRRIVPSRSERLAQARNNLFSDRKPLLGVANKVEPIITRRRNGKGRKSPPSDKEEPNLATNSDTNSALDRVENTEYPSYDEMHDPAPPRGRYTPSPNRVSDRNSASESKNISNIQLSTDTTNKHTFKRIKPSLTPKPLQLTLNTQNEPTLLDTTTQHEIRAIDERVLQNIDETPNTKDQTTSSQDSMILQSSSERVSTSSRSSSSDPDYDLYYDYEDPADSKGPAVQRPFSYGYKINAKESGNFHSRTETRNEKEVIGSYEVALPDGRIQVVSYVADDDGFRAEVTYKEKTKNHNEPTVGETEKTIITTTNKNERVTQSPNFINIVRDTPKSFSFRNIALPQVTPLPLTNQGTLLPNHLNINTFGAKESFLASLDEENNVIPDPIGGLVTTIEPPINSFTDYEYNELENIPQAPVYPENSFDFQNRPLHPNDISSSFIEPSPKPIPPPVNREIARIPPNPFIRNRHKNIHKPIKPRPKLVINKEPPIHPLLKPGKFNRPVTIAPPNPRVQGRRPFSRIHPNSGIPNPQGPGTRIQFPNIQSTPFHSNNHFPNQNHIIQRFPNFPTSTENPFPNQNHLIQRFPNFPTSTENPFPNQNHLIQRFPNFPTSTENPFPNQNHVIQRFPNFPTSTENPFPNQNHLIQRFPNFPTSTQNPLLQQFPEIHRQVSQFKPGSLFNTKPVKGRLDFNKFHTFPTTSPNPFKIVIDGTRTSRIQPTQKPIHTTTTSLPHFNVRLTPTTTPHPNYVDQINQNFDYYDYPDYEAFPFGGHVELLKTKTSSPILPIHSTTPSPPTSFPLFSLPTTPSPPFSPSPVITTPLPPTTFRFFKPVTTNAHFGFGGFPSTISPTGGTSLINQGLSHGPKSVFRAPRPHHFRAVIRSPKTDTIKNLFQNSVPKLQKPLFRSPRVKHLKDSFVPSTPVNDVLPPKQVLSEEFPKRSQVSTPPHNSVSSGLFNNRPFPTSSPVPHVKTSAVNVFGNRPILTTPRPIPYRLVLRKKVVNPMRHHVNPHIPSARKPVLFHYPLPNGNPSTPLLYNPNQKVVLEALGKTHSIPLLLPISGSASEQLEVVDKRKKGLSVLPDKNTTLEDRELIFSKSDIYPRHLPLSKVNRN